MEALEAKRRATLALLSVLFLLALLSFLNPNLIRVEGAHLFLAFPGRGVSTNPFLPPEATLRRWAERLRREMGALEGLVGALEGSLEKPPSGPAPSSWEG